MSERTARVLLAAALVVALGFFVAVIGGPPQRVVSYVSDDAFYYTRIATHLAAGDGPTFDGITRTTGFHPLYAFLLAAAVRVFGLGETGVPAFAIGLNAACFLLTGLALRAAAARLFGAGTGLWPALLWYANPHAILLVVTGMEGSLYGLAVAVLACALAHVGTGRETGGALASGLVLGTAGAFCYAARTDAPVVLGLAGLWLLVGPREPPWRRLVRAFVFGAVTAVPALLWIGYCREYGGAFLQGSAFIKVLHRQEAALQSGLAGLALATARTALAWCTKCLVKVPVLKYVLPFAGGLSGPAAARPRRYLVHWLWVAPVALGVVYAVLLPRAWTWYYAPALVLLTLLAAGCLESSRLPRPGGRITRIARAALPALLLFAAVESYGYFALKGLRGRNDYQQDMLEVARWLRDHVPEDAVVAAWNSGTYSWYSHRTVINLDGLVNNEIVGLHRGLETLPDYLRRHRVEYLVDYDELFRDNVRDWPGARFETVFHLRSAFRRGQNISVKKIDWE